MHKLVKKIFAKKQSVIADKSKLSQQDTLSDTNTEPNFNYRAIFNAVNDALFILEIETGKILDVNNKMSEMYGYTREEALKIDLETLSSGVFPYDQKMATKRIHLTASGYPQIFEWHGKNKEGELFWVEVSLIKANIDGVDRIIASVRDIAARKVVEEQILKISKSKDEFISMVAHQLRTPLSSMRWNIELLLRDIEGYNINSEALDLITKNYQSNLKLIDLVNNLLVIPKIEQKRLSDKTDRFSLNDLLEEIIEDYNHQSRLKLLEIKLRVNKNYRYFVNMNQVQIKEALSNVIDNAIKYSYKKTKIQVSLNRKDKFFEIKISNVGIGVPTNDNELIFEKFFRAKNAIQDSSDGTGLGLFIARSFVEKIEGSILFSSNTDQITTFIVRIPTSITR